MPPMPESPGPTPTPDELHARFRQALERKAGKKAASASAEHGEAGAKASSRTGNSKRHREFRRKSGG
jgi:hypothetical protein